MLLLAQSSSETVTVLKEILDGGLPLVLAVIVVVQGYVVYKLLQNMALLEQAFRSKIEELLEGQIKQQAPLTEALVQTRAVLERVEKLLDRR